MMRPNFNFHGSNFRGQFFIKLWIFGFIMLAWWGPLSSRGLYKINAINRCMDCLECSVFNEATECTAHDVEDSSIIKQLQKVNSLSIPLGFYQLLENVLSNHPTLKQANNYIPIAKAELMIARGAFDPMISYYRTEKNTAGGNFYQTQNLDFYIPNYFGGGLSVTNPYANTGGIDNGSLGLGLEIPLLKGLITDYRRTALGKAKINVEMSQAQRDQWINDLVHEVFIQYTQWLLAHESANQIEQVLRLAKERQFGLRRLFDAGAGTSVDTLETHVQLQQYRAKYQLALWKKEKQRLMISMFLWNSQGQPIEPLPGVYPIQDGLSWIDSMVVEANRFFSDTQEATLLQPSLRLSILKLQSQQLEFRLAKNQMLPSLNLQYGYNQTGREWQFNPTQGKPTAGLGLGFQSSLFFRQQRGQYRQLKYEIINTQLEINNKRRGYDVKSKAMYQEYQIHKDQWLQWRSISENQLSLYKMEARRLEAGDVNFFILNTREMRLLDINLLALEYKYQYQAIGVGYLHFLGWLSSN